MPNDPDHVALLQAVRGVDWAAYAAALSAPWYRPDKVPAAFGQLLTASSRDEGRKAYHSVLNSVGNDHAGCLHPAAAPAVRLLARAVREHQGWARWTALEVLIEFLAFDVDQEEFIDPSGSATRTKDVILTAVQELRPDLERLAHEQLTDATAKSARDLLQNLDDELADTA